MSQRLTDLCSRVAADEWDADAWLALCLEASSTLPSRDAAPHLERATSRFPTAGRIWKMRIECVAKAQGQTSADHIAAIFQDGVKVAPTAVELWRAYGTWATENPETAEPVRVYEDAIKAAGLDLMASPLWSDYISLLNKIDWNENQRRDALRKLYQRAVMSLSTPCHFTIKRYQAAMVLWCDMIFRFRCGGGGGGGGGQNFGIAPHFSVSIKIKSLVSNIWSQLVSSRFSMHFAFILIDILKQKYGNHYNLNVSHLWLFVPIGAQSYA